MSTLHISRTVYDSMRAHGEKSYPRECCGALLGRSSGGEWTVVAALPAVNICADPARRYQIAPAELVRIHAEAAGQGLEIAGFYHSHPDHPASWSRADLSEAHWVGCCYVITEVAAGRAAATNSFLLAGTREEDKRFEPQILHVCER